MSHIDPVPDGLNIRDTDDVDAVAYAHDTEQWALSRTRRAEDDRDAWRKRAVMAERIADLTAEQRDRWMQHAEQAEAARLRLRVEMDTDLIERAEKYATRGWDRAEQQEGRALVAEYRAASWWEVAKRCARRRSRVLDTASRWMRRAETAECQCAAGELVELHERGTYAGDQQVERIAEAIDWPNQLNGPGTVSAVLDALRKESEPHPDWVDYVEGRNGEIYAGDED